LHGDQIFRNENFRKSSIVIQHMKIIETFLIGPKQK